MSSAKSRRSGTDAPNAIVSVLRDDGTLDPTYDPHLTDDEVKGL